MKPCFLAMGTSAAQRPDLLPAIPQRGTVTESPEPGALSARGQHERRRREARHQVARVSSDPDSRAGRLHHVR